MSFSTVRPTALAALLVLASALAAAGSPIDSQRLSEPYRLWLEEEVPYIITPTERDVFLDLRTDRERDVFIEAFWKHRDPSPGTETNEFRDEHFRRLAHANRYFRGTGRPGWKTDRGKVYVILGEPRSIRSFSGSDAYFPAEMWSYDSLERPGLPRDFNLLFFQKGRIGDYILYHPAMDGPWGLMTNYKGDPGDYIASFATLEIIEPELARAAISLLPNESIRQAPSMMSTMLLQNLDAAAYRGVEDTYAKKFREFKDIVDVDYSANYVDSGGLVRVLRDPGGLAFVHWALEPANLSMGRFDGKIATDLTFNGNLTDAGGRFVHQFDKTVTLRFTPDQFETFRQRPFLFADVFPVLPGRYRFSVLMKNSVSKEFTSFEQSIEVPEPGAASPRLGPPLLGFSSAAEAPGPVPKPFTAGGIQVYAQPGRTFLTRDRLIALVQVLDLPADPGDRGALRIGLERDDGEQVSRTRSLAESPDRLNVIESFDLSDLPPGYYRAVIVLLDANGREIDRRREDFQISPAASIPRPWVHARTALDEAGPAMIDHVVGRQLASTGDHAGAADRLEKALRADPHSAVYAVDLARSYEPLGRFADMAAVLSPFEDRLRTDFELGFLLGRAHQALGAADRALRIYGVLLDAFGLNIQVLNASGYCHLAGGDKAAARSAWTRSLEISPDQPAIRGKLSDLDKRD